MSSPQFADSLINRLIPTDTLLAIAEACTVFVETKEESEYGEELRGIGWSQRGLRKVVHEIGNQVLLQSAKQNDDIDHLNSTELIWFSCPLWAVATISAILRETDEMDEAQWDEGTPDTAYMMMRVLWYPFLAEATRMAQKHDKQENLFLESWKDEETE